MWHRLLCFLKIRDEFDYTPPFAPEVNHPYEQDGRLRCCTHCGGGKLHKIHSEPYDPKRLDEINTMRTRAAYDANVERIAKEHIQQARKIEAARKSGA